MFFPFTSGQITYNNVALKKPVYLSSDVSNDLAKYGVDGLIDNKTAIVYGDRDSSWFVVDLVHDYQVKYIVLYKPSCQLCGK